MILVDTSVVSEPLKSTPEPRVLAWLDRQPSSALFLSTVSIANMMSGIEAMPQGERRESLACATRNIVERLFGDRILPFDLAAARSYGQARLRARAQGLDIPVVEAQIAAIALAAGFSIATRHPAPFEAAGVSTINPWED
jgi:predicted nucleic acid-binding protein